jgi:two-component system CitB family sensor kinase
MNPRRLSLASQILLLQLAVIVTAVAVGAAVSVVIARQQLDRTYEDRAITIGQSVASMPSVRDALRDADPSRTLQPLAEGIRKAAGATFVVITDQRGIRLSHPNPALIGKPIDESPEDILRGQTFVGIQNGTLGRSVRGKVPIRDDTGTVIGLVSVGFKEDFGPTSLLSEAPLIGSFLIVALALGAGGSLFLARRLKRQTFGLEPREIVGLLEQREASLHGIREGTVAIDRAGRITLANAEARRLLGLPDKVEGRVLADVLPEGRARDVLTSESADPDQVVIVGDRVLVVNRVPVQVRGEPIGSVVTLRDRVELETLLRQLWDARSLTDALRAQAHEFSNRLHTIAGLLEMGKYDEAIRSTTAFSSLSQELSESLLTRVGDPQLAALLLAKAALATERGIEFLLSSDSDFTATAIDSRDLVTITGNLIDNAFDAVRTPECLERRVEVSVRSDARGAELQVRDSGPGIAPDIRGKIFTEGFTTKSRSGRRRRGLGLALVMQVVRRYGGEVDVDTSGATTFLVKLPVREGAAVE